MKQLVQNMRSGETLVIDTPIPKPSRGQVLVRTAASLVSAGTERMVVEFAGKSLLGKARSRPDLMKQVLDKARREGLVSAMDAAFNRLDQPLSLGYSSAGQIVGMGDGVVGLKVGQRVACAGGGYAVHAEYAIVPQRLVTPLPDQVDFESAAFTTLGSIALHGFRLSECQLGERIAVIGLGLLGMLAASLAKAAGCQVIGIEVDLDRIKLAEQMGFMAVMREGAEEAAEFFSRGRGCDAVLICADTQASDPVELAGKIARDRARVVAIGAVGLNIPRKLYFEKELTFINSRSYGPGRYDPEYEEKGRDYPIGYVRWTEGRNLEAFVDLLSVDRIIVRELVTHRFSIEEASQAYSLITGISSEPFLGVLLTYPHGVEETRLVIQAAVNADKSKLNESPIKPTGAKPADRIRLGVLGAGNFASAVMLPVMSKSSAVDLVGVVSASGISAQRAMRRFHFKYATSDEDEVLKDEGINAVAILTRHHLHAGQVLSALKAGKHVFCEKPLALTMEELADIEGALEAIHQAAQEDMSFRPPLLTVGFNRRFAPLAQRMRSFLQESPEPLFCSYRINAGYLPENHWTQDAQQGGGRLLGEACHFIDFLTFLVGQAPLAVSAHRLPDEGRYHEDNFLLTCEFPDGSLGAISYLANGDRSFGKERVEAFSGGRVAVLDDFRQLHLVFDGKTKVHRLRFRQDKGHQAEWDAFIVAVHAGGPPPIPYTHLIGATKTAFAALKSLREGQKITINQGELDDQERI